MQHFLRNAWYMAAWSEELGEPLLSRRIAGRALVLYRGEDGAPAALDDRCPHRFAPLSQGRREGDAIVCGYHGLTFDRSGACVRNPFSDRTPPRATVRSWPLHERDGLVWLWRGAPEAADPGLIPDFSMLAENPVSRTLHGYVLMKAGYEYGTDNLMDLSHIEFVHTGSFAGAGVIFAGKHEVLKEDETLRSNWWMPGVKAPGHTAGIYPPDMVTDHWLDMRWNAPASMHLEIGAVPAGQPRAGGIIVQQAHILTPETDGTTHYFWATTVATPPGAPDMSEMVRQLMSQAFDVEDKPMIEAAYANLEGEDFRDQPPVSIGVDRGGILARRKIQALLERESATGVAAQ